MKHFWNLLLVLFTLTGITACNKSKNEEKQIIGTWIYLDAGHAKLLSFDEYHEFVSYDYSLTSWSSEADDGIYEFFPNKNMIILYPNNSEPRKIEYKEMDSDSLVVQLNWGNFIYTETYLKMSANRYLPKKEWTDSIAIEAEPEVVADTVVPRW